MITGELAGLVSTNALELGIDIGSLDCTVLAGYPEHGLHSGSRREEPEETGKMRKLSYPGKSAF